MMEREQLEAAITALEGQRALLGDSVVDPSIAALRVKLASLAPESEPQLRQVTILFLDVVGSTALSQHLDPEDIASIMDGALARGTAIIEAQRGKVLNYAGDNLLAVFGAEESVEDDAERAVRSGLLLLALGQVLAMEVAAAHGQHGFDVRVGIHTGWVLLGSAADAGGDIRGQAVNVAARMEQTAPPGALRISHDTFAQVRGIFDVQAEPPILVKGVDTPMQTYLVKSAKPRAFRVMSRGIEGIETRMIGRAAELGTMQTSFERLLVERRLAALSVVGEAGLGKSRLIYEFANWAEARPENFLVFEARATPSSRDQPYGLLRNLLAWRFEIADGDTMATAQVKFEQALLPLFEPEDGPDDAEAHIHLLGFLIGLDYAKSRHIEHIREDAKQIRSRGFYALALLFRRMAARNGMPILMQLDDLHWADDPSLDFFVYLSQVARDVPMLIVGLARPSLFERRANWIAAEAHTRIDLMPLDETGSECLVDELLQKLPQIPACLRKLLSGGAAGNPFYMEELIKMLIDQGAIAAVGEVWQLDTQRLVGTQVPRTLVGVLQARLDGLPVAERRALQSASVIGLIFWDQALAALDAAAPSCLPDLARRALALPQAGAALSAMRQYGFKHQILHQVTYETVLKRARRMLHARAGDWFAGLTDARASDFTGVAARHYAEAGDAANAIEYFARSAEQAKSRFAHETALDMVGAALQRIDQLTDLDARARLEWRLLDVRERTFELQGKRAAQEADLDRLAALADEWGDAGLSADIAGRRAHRAARMADWPAMNEAARRSLTFAETAGDPVRQLRARRVVATASAMLGDIEGGRQMAVEGLAQAQRLRLRVIEGSFLNTLAILAEMSGDGAGGLALVKQQLVIAQEIGDRRNESVGRSNLATGLVKFGAFEAASREAEAALTLARGLGDRVFESVALNLLSEAALYSGAIVPALCFAEAAVQIAVETEGKGEELIALLSLGEIELALGRPDSAAISFARALDLSNMVGVVHQDAQAGLARVALAQGDAAAAVGHLEPVLAELGDGGALEGVADLHLIHLTCWQALDRAGDARAGALLDLAFRAHQSTADSISDMALRDSFRSNHPTSRAILKAWSERQAPAPG
jgi:class 3 adenylate cyclase/tetratricopeptide (TPR) repeat protein